MIFEVVMDNIEIRTEGLGSREALSGPLGQELSKRGLGAVVRGGGTGMVRSEIRVAMDDDFELMDAMEELRELLRELGAPPSTRISSDYPRRYTWLVWDE